MEYGGVHRLFVEQDGGLAGVISRSDIVRAHAVGKL
jgi:CBS domain-containing protein